MEEDLHFTGGESGVQSMLSAIQDRGREYTEEELYTDLDWIEASGKIYEMNEGKKFEGDYKILAKYGIDQMSEFNYNVALGTIPDVMKVEQADNETQIAFAYLMDTYDKKDITMAGFKRAVGNAVFDPTNWIGASTLGAGFALKKMGQSAVKEGFKAKLHNSIRSYLTSGLAVGATEGALYTAGDEVAKESIYQDAGLMDGYSGTNIASSAVAGALAGGTIAKGIEVGTPVLMQGAKRGLEMGLDKFERSPLNASAHIVPVEQARELPYPSAIKDYELLDEISANTEGASLSSEGLRINLQRFQKPEQEGEQSVRTGVFYLPYGDANKKHYKKKDTFYGGTQEISGETLLKRPFIAKGATGGKAPEFAYDAVKGKGSAYNLGINIRNHIMSMPKHDNERAYYVEELLDNYGGDSSVAYDIVINSKQGNQLVYAIQENIIANTLRGAGYDSIVGYSKTKAGNKISEVFDLREANYPYKTMGDVEVHPKFEYAGQWNKSKETK